MITVFSKPGCPQCKATIRALDQRGIEYMLIDVEDVKAAREEIINRGYHSVPVVVTDATSWSGYRPDCIAQI